ncbi:class I SAM-dependent DNA methyltransferase [Leifsonia poae]|uniref:Methyltransferase n=1 Tax=Leifsonia poae TaxID=110933 RepID=A0A9W6M0A7_9MICO|nr:class I SAM-dependent methyltransferase [Leifsonia poae]GLJ76681.1 methyltransferase [Leifsonia poae]
MSEHADVAATRLAYDTVASDYAALLRDELASKPLDRAMLSAFAEEVLAAGGGAVADLGCGPGRVTAQLVELGLDAFGIDLSPGMIDVARSSHPGLRFEVGSMAALPLGGDELAGAVAWYSVIHTPPERQGELFAEFARVLRPGGLLLLAFQVGDDVVHLTKAYGHDIALDAYRQSPARIRMLLAEAGLVETVWLERAPRAPEKVPQAYVLAALPE